MNTLCQQRLVRRIAADMLKETATLRRQGKTVAACDVDEQMAGLHEVIESLQRLHDLQAAFAGVITP